MSKNSEQLNENQLQRFTTLINPLVLSHIKLIGYFTNRKLYEVINDSLELMIKEFESKSNTKIEDIINLQSTLTKQMDKESKS
tara:strand:- start:1022 stop:1270 length:249 start_codon:yes stop_codon:yes gene_type:complete